MLRQRVFKGKRKSEGARRLSEAAREAADRRRSARIPRLDHSGWSVFQSPTIPHLSPKKYREIEFIKEQKIMVDRYKQNIISNIRFGALH